MSTPNFHLNNAKDYFCFYNEVEDCETGEKRTRDYVDWMIVGEDIQYMGEDKGFSAIPSGDRMRKAEYLGVDEPLIDKDFENKYLTFEAGIGLNSGHYTGANMDWDIIFRGGYMNFCLSDYRDDEEFCADIYDYLTDWGTLSDWNEGCKKMNASKVIKYLFARVEEIRKECDKFCRDNCEVVCECAGVFSNGEAIYMKIA